MFTDRFKSLFRVSLLLALGTLAGLAAAHREQGQRKLVDDMEVELGIVPSEDLRGRPAGTPEKSMHAGVPKGKAQYHVLIAVFNRKTKQRISDAVVEATVGEVGFRGERKKLDPMAINDTITYGNYFRMPGVGPYVIAVKIRTPGMARAAEVRFDHKHE
ncbi:MAG: hypothetical protein HYU77_01910 [Betaproteobacteria bacterium]|nr:hypothetical protein [Betaproteobacteria bacterium]